MMASAGAAEKSRVLVVDDEPQITRVLRTVLTSQGYQVRTAAEGEAALTSFAEFRPELVITDLYMPHMDGLELCKRIRAVSAVPIIVLSVKGEERTKVEALDAGADDYVTKPFGIDELLARLRAALRRMDAVTGPVVELGELVVDLEEIVLALRLVLFRSRQVDGAADRRDHEQHRDRPHQPGGAGAGGEVLASDAHRRDDQLQRLGRGRRHRAVFLFEHDAHGSDHGRGPAEILGLLLAHGRKPN